MLIKFKNRLFGGFFIVLCGLNFLFLVGTSPHQTHQIKALCHCKECFSQPTKCCEKYDVAIQVLIKYPAKPDGSIHPRRAVPALCPGWGEYTVWLWTRFSPAGGVAQRAEGGKFPAPGVEFKFYFAFFFNQA
jgi:hypothetical protein